jgi:hypothetical protein
MEAPVPAAPRRGGRWDLHVLCLHMSVAGPRKAQEGPISSEVLLSNIACTSPERFTAPSIEPLQGGRFQNREHFSFHVSGHGARIRKVCEICCRSQVSDSNLAHNISISQAGVGDHFRKSFRCRLELAMSKKTHEEDMRSPAVAGKTRFFVFALGPREIPDSSGSLCN